MVSIESTRGGGALLCVCVCSNVYALRKESLEQRGGGGTDRGSEDMHTLNNDPQCMLRGFCTLKKTPK